MHEDERAARDDLREARPGSGAEPEPTERDSLDLPTEALPPSSLTSQGGGASGFEAYASYGLPPPPSLADPLLGLPRIDAHRYVDRQPIGRGGMGEVLAVRDETLRRILAMKVLLPSTSKVARSDPRNVERFLREARVTAHLDHPGVVPVHELGVDVSGRPYFTMKRVEGEELRAIIEKAHEHDDGWTINRVVATLVQVCETVAFAHSRGVIHRDLKPANIMVGEFGAVYVMDWGLARMVEDPPTGTYDSEGRDAMLEDVEIADALTIPGRALGSPPFMPPEQVDGDPDQLGPPTDVYAIGAMLYQLLTRSVPYGDLTTRSLKDVLRAVKSSPPRSVSELAPDAPPELVSICSKAMSRDIGERYEDARALADDLRNYLEGRVVTAHRTGLLIETRKWIRRNQALTLALCAAVILMAAGIIGFVVQQRRLANQARSNSLVLEGKNQELQEQSAELEARNLEVEAKNREVEAKNQQIAEALAQEQRARERAVAARRQSEALRLVETSKVVAETDTTLAVHLAVQANRRLDNPESRQALLQALARNHELLAVRGHDSYPLSASMAPPGGRFVTFANEPIAVLWAVRGARPLARLTHDEETVTAAFAFGANRETHALTGDAQGRVRSWTVQPPAADELPPVSIPPAAEIRLHDSPVRTIQWQSGHLLVAHSGGPLFVAEWSDGTLSESAFVELPAHERSLRAARLSDESDLVYSVGGDGVARATTLAGRIVGEAQVPPDPRRLRLDESGRLLVATHDDRVEVLSLDSGTLLLSEAAVGGVLGRRGELAAVWKPRDGGARTEVVVHELLTGEVRATFSIPGQIREQDFSPDGALLATSLTAASGDDYRIFVHESAAGTLAQTLAGHTYEVTEIQFVDNERVLSSGSDVMTRLWTIRPPLTKQVDLSLGGTRDPRGAELIALASRGPGGKVLSRPTANGRQLEVLDAGGDLVYEVETVGEHIAAEFAPDGDAVVLCVERGDGGARHWRLLRLPHEPGEAPTILETSNRYARFNKSGKIVSFGDRGWPPGSEVHPIHVFDATTGERLHEFRPTDDYVGSQVSPDGKRVVTADRQLGSVSIYDFETKERILNRKGMHEGWAIDASWMPDGRHVLSTAVDTSVRFWNAQDLAPAFRVTGLSMAELELRLHPTGAMIAARGPSSIVLIEPDVGIHVEVESDGEPFRGCTITRSRLVAFTASGQIHRFPLDPLGYAERRSLRDLGATEIRKYRILEEEDRVPYLRAHTMRSIHMSAWLSWATECRTSGDVEGAIAALARILELRPDDDDTRLMLAETLLEEGTAGEHPPAAKTEFLERALPRYVELIQRGRLPLRALQRARILAPLRELPSYPAALESLEGSKK